MNFKKLEVFGFKSFADKLEIKFNNGITGIVGPNGCGKSNVADAIRWVLGEQSAKLLRGSQMMDVIFNGTENRKSLSYCEVSLYFDNSQKVFPIEYDELVISRKLYRSGESEYSLNKTVCRLKDILDILRDCGIGKEGYSIIGQGRIDEVLSARPEERRSIFEEACGISKFKVKKIETERKLLRTHDNLLRLNDILTEIERQLNPLSSQAENAKIYLDLKEKLKSQEINNYICLYESINSTKKTIEERLNAINEEYTLKEDEYNGVVKEYEELFQSFNNIDKDINNLRNSQLKISVDVEKQSGEYKLLNERIARLTEQNEILKVEIDKNVFQNDKDKSILAELEKTKHEKQQEYEVLLKESDELSTQFLAIVNRIAKGEDDVENNQRKVIESIDKLSVIKSNLSSLLTEKNVLGERLSETLNGIDTLKGKVEELKKGLLSAENEYNILSNNNKEENAKREKNAQVYNNLLQKQKENTAEISRLQSAISSLRTKQSYLKQVKENYEGYNYSVKALLSSVKNNTTLQSKIEGAVAMLIKVPQKYEVAIDVALGQGMQNVVTSTQENAKYLINYLKQNRMGRITFLPMDAIKERIIDKTTENLAKSCTGYLGIAADLVQYDKKYYNIISSLLGKTLVCDTLDNAVLLSRKISYSAKIVTLDGDVIHAFGAMTGGSRKNEVSQLLGYDREINESGEKLNSAEQNLKKAEDYGHSIEKQTAEIYEELTRLSRVTHNNDIELAKQGEQLDRQHFQVSREEENLVRLGEEKSKIEARLNYINGELKTADELEVEITAQRSNADDVRIEQKEQYDELRKQRDKLHEKTTNIKVKLASLYSEISYCAENITSIKLRTDEIEKDVKAAEGLIQRNILSVKEAEEQKSSFSFDTVSEEELKTIKSKLENLDSYKFEIQSRLSQADKKRVAYSAELQKLSENRIKEEGVLSKVDIDLDIMKDRIWEEYQITYDTAQEYRAENFDYPSSNGIISKLKKQISNLGYVNVNAIEDFKVLKERYDELDVQINDLNKAEEDLKKIIADLTEEMVSRFTHGFNDINANFTKVFKELFGGGNARLVLDTEETDDPLTAGIEIVAEPPGKKLQSISLLSGGERALTAIAILFAILKLRPMPFCVLDEIEAALDDVNAMRFAKYLKSFTGQTQFIVITHRKPTMELADSLYGVTMQEKGVSKIVSVKLSEALSNIKEPA